MTLDNKRMLAPPDDEKGDENDSKNKVSRAPGPEDDPTAEVMEGTTTGDGSAGGPSQDEVISVPAAPPLPQGQSNAEVLRTLKEMIKQAKTGNPHSLTDDERAYLSACKAELFDRLRTASEDEVATVVEALSAISIISVNLREEQHYPAVQSLVIRLTNCPIDFLPGVSLGAASMVNHLNGAEYLAASKARTEARHNVRTAFGCLQSALAKENRAFEHFRDLEDVAQIGESLYFAVDAAIEAKKQGQQAADAADASKAEWQSKYEALQQKHARMVSREERRKQFFDQIAELDRADVAEATAEAV